MPSEKILSEKQAYVAALREKLMNSVAGVVVEYKGISVADDTKLRAELRAAGDVYKRQPYFSAYCMERYPMAPSFS